MAANASVRRYALVTGGSSGIGLATARGLTARFDVVGIVGRDADRLRQAARTLESGDARIETFRADFSRLGDVARLAADVRSRFESLSVLVNNAGAWYRTRTLTKDGYEATFAVNHLAHFLLTNELKAALAAVPSRVVNVSSSTHRRPKSLNWDDLMFEKGWKGFSAYAHSKLANVLFSNELARRWQSEGIASNALHPGNVRSRITRDNPVLNLLHRSSIARLFILSEEEGAQTSLFVATSPKLEGITGHYFDDCKDTRPGEAAQDPEAGRRLWEVSEHLVAAATRS